MIAKQVSMRSARKSDFGDLVRYITDTQGNLQRVGTVTVTNCVSDNPFDAAVEVRLTQRKNTRSGADKTYHLVVSFRVGEQPSAAVLKAIERRLCEGLGFGEHQRISALHHDTDNLHIHIAINKVHPTRHTVHSPYCDHATLAKLCEELEATYGLQTDNHAPQQRGAQSRAVEMEKHAGVESLVGWVQRECLDRIQSAASWAQLHDTLSEYGLALRERANGFVLADRDGHHAKASSVDRSLSKPQLEKRLGPFEPSARLPDGPPVVPGVQYEKRRLPSRVDTSALYAQYEEEREQRGRARAAETVVLQQRQSAELDLHRRRGDFQRAAIRLMGGNRLTRKALYGLAALTRKADIAQVREQHRRERQFLRQQYARMDWADWLQAQAERGNPEALEVVQVRQDRESRESKAWVVNPSDWGVTRAREAGTGVKTYHVGGASIRDDGAHLHVSHGAGLDAIDAALHIALERYGQRIQVAGSDEFKTRVVAAAVRSVLPVTFADAALEQSRQAHSPAVFYKARKFKDDHQERRRVDARGTGAAQPGATYDHRAEPGDGAGRGRSGVRAWLVGGGQAAPSSRDAAADTARPAQRGKPHVGRVGIDPPPAAKNRLRSLSQLGVVQFAERSEVLLPGDVSGRLEQPGTQSDHALRRPVSGAGAAITAHDAIAMFIAERDAKRNYINDISKYKRYTNDKDTSGKYGGTRRVQGHFLALLQRDDAVNVLSIDAETARQLKRFRIGDAVTVHAQRQTQPQTPDRAAVPTYTFRPRVGPTMTPKKGRSR